MGIQCALFTSISWSRNMSLVFRAPHWFNRVGFDNDSVDERNCVLSRKQMQLINHTKREVLTSEVSTQNRWKCHPQSFLNSRKVSTNLDNRQCPYYRVYQKNTCDFPYCILKVKAKERLSANNTFS
jgi:hypothetical protein